jgi:hypothetical protein
MGLNTMSPIYAFQFLMVIPISIFLLRTGPPKDTVLAPSQSSEKQNIDTQIANSSGAIREQWK